MGSRRSWGNFLSLMGILILMYGLYITTFDFGAERIWEHLREFPPRNKYRLNIDDVIFVTEILFSVSLVLGLGLFFGGRALKRSGQKSDEETD